MLIMAVPVVAEALGFNKFPKIMKKSITLVELLIALSLLLVIILGAVAFDIASRRFLNSSEDETILLNEMALTLDYLARDINLATGDLGNSGIAFTGTTLTIRIDTDPPTPATYVGDPLIVYDFTVPNITRSFDGGAAQNLSPNLTAIPAIVAPSAAIGAAIVGVVPAEGGVRLTSIVLSDGANIVSIEDVGGTPTIYYFPLSHSWR